MKVRDVTPEWIAYQRLIERDQRVGYANVLDALAVAIPALQKIVHEMDAYHRDGRHPNLSVVLNAAWRALDTEIGGES